MEAALQEYRTKKNNGAAAAASEGGDDKEKNGKGGANIEDAANASWGKVLRKIVPIVANIERRIGTLEDRCTFVVILKDEEWKGKVVDIRNMWREIEKTRREKFKKDKENSKEAILDPHPFGGQKQAVLRLIAELMFQNLTSQDKDEHRKALDMVVKSSISLLDAILFRGKPRFATPKQDRAWVWAFIFAETAPAEARKTLESLYTMRCAKAHISPQRSQDGPLLKWLLEWGKSQREQKEEDDAVEMDESFLEGENSGRASASTKKVKKGYGKTGGNGKGSKRGREKS